MRLLLIALLLAGLCMAFSVKPDYLGVQDTGDESLGTMDVGITIDCDTKVLTIDVMDESEQPIENANTYLFYTDYGYHALPNPGKTDADGISIMEVPGNIRFLTAMFILRVDHPNFQSREIEFVYQKCFEPPPQPPPPEPDVTNVTEEEPTPPPEDVTEPPNVTENVTPVTPPPNVTPPEDMAPEPEEPSEPSEAPLCPLALLLLGPLIFRLE